MTFDLMFLRAVFALATLFAFSFVLQRFYWKRRGRGRKSKFGFYPSTQSLGNALQALQVMAQPQVRHVVEEKLQEEAEEDDEGDLNDPARRLEKQLRRIRNGERVDDLAVPFRP
jgi:hypothetical protein